MLHNSQNVRQSFINLCCNEQHKEYTKGQHKERTKVYNVSSSERYGLHAGRKRKKAMRCIRGREYLCTGAASSCYRHYAVVFSVRGRADAHRGYWLGTF